LTGNEIVVDDWVDDEGVTRGEQTDRSKWKSNIQVGLEDELSIECREPNYPEVRAMLLEMEQDYMVDSPTWSAKLRETVERLDRTFKYNG